MDSNDFIFSDDVAESLGSRTVDADSDAIASESGRPGLAAMGVVGFAILSLMALLERHTHL